MRSKLIYAFSILLPLLTHSACSSDDDTSSGGGSGGVSGKARARAAGHAGTNLGGIDSGGADLGGSDMGGAGATGPGGEAGASEAGAAGTAATLSDGQILEVLIHASAGEVSAADVAKPAAQSAAVTNFAQMMITDHSAGEQQALALVSSQHVAPAESNVSDKLDTEAAALLVTLSQTPATEFDQTYMQAQVNMHQEVLGLIDARLLPNVSNAALKTLLTGTRTTVATHLSEATMILGAL